MIQYIIDIYYDLMNEQDIYADEIKKHLHHVGLKEEKLKKQDEEQQGIQDEEQQGVQDTTLLQQQQQQQEEEEARNTLYQTCLFL